MRPFVDHPGREQRLRAWAITDDTTWQDCSICSGQAQIQRRHDNGVCMYDPRSPLCKLITQELRSFQNTEAAEHGMACLHAHAPTLV